MGFVFSKNFLIILLSVALAVLLLFHVEGCNKRIEQESINKSLSDTLHKTINKLGQELAYKKLILGTFAQLKSINTDKDSLLKQLKNSVDKNTLSSTELVNTTVTHTSTKTIVLEGTKEIHHDTVFVYPIYKAAWHTKWTSGNVYASKDSVQARDTTINEFELKTEYKRDHFYTGRYPVVSVLNKNPNTKTLDVASFHLKEDAGKQSRVVVFIEGVIAGFIGYNLIKK